MRKIYFTILITIACIFISLPVFAQDKLMLSITPPLIKNNVSPGQIFRSTIKLVNNNAEEIEIFVQVKDFKSGQESGTVEFLENQIANETDNPHLLSGWLQIEPGPYPVKPYATVDIPFAINVPAGAEPGGHYGAILAGTNPTADTAGGSAIKISSLLASLILLNVSGEITENGRIREFSTDKSWYQEPTVTFTVNFENLGNVHLQPQGEIKVFSMWNKDKGRIKLNHDTDFGNVLPQSSRLWRFGWEGDGGLLAMGRYKALLVLGYGDEARQTIDQTLYFWYLPYKPLLLIIVVILGLALLFTWSIRAYIRRSIIRTQQQIGMFTPPQNTGGKKIAVDREDPRPFNLKASITQSVEPSTARGGKISFKTLKRFGLGALILSLIVVAILLIFKNRLAAPVSDTADQISTLAEPRGLNVVEREIEDTGSGSPANPGGVTAETIAENIENASTTVEGEPAATSTALSTADGQTAATSTENNDEETFNKAAVIILNGSGRTGLAGEASKLLEQGGFPVSGVGNADNFDYPNTLIKYKPYMYEQAVRISQLFSEQVELQENSKQPEDIIVIVGKDFRK